ncbi:MAG: hypothetical protein M1820_005896 [Bogoriella megaspora]|nr:MAG: hypothetical protein M1820_005896 [Bogoriella megaspora]
MAGSENLQEIYGFAVQLGKDAGKLLLQAVQSQTSRSGTASSQSQEFVEKANAVDLVTKTDEGELSHAKDFEVVSLNSIAAQKLRLSLKIVFQHNIRLITRFIGEESYSKGSAREYLIDERPTWCVDPLDGLHILPPTLPDTDSSRPARHAFILNHEPVVGVIYAPFMDQLFSAYKGGGAWMNRTQQLPLVRDPIPPMPASAPKGCIFSFEWGKDRRDAPDSNMHLKVESLVNMAAEIGGRNGKGGMVHGVRSLGSATLDLAYCAMGAFDIWWEGGCWEWDVAAGICLLQEAGGLVTTANPPEDPATAPVEPAKLGSRLYLAIRCCTLMIGGWTDPLEHLRMSRGDKAKSELYERYGAG